MKDPPAAVICGLAACFPARSGQGLQYEKLLAESAQEIIHAGAIAHRYGVRGKMTHCGPDIREDRKWGRVQSGKLKQLRQDQNA